MHQRLKILPVYFKQTASGGTACRFLSILTLLFTLIYLPGCSGAFPEDNSLLVALIDQVSGKTSSSQTVYDNYVITGTTGSLLPESGGAASFGVALAKQPTANVTLSGLVATDTTEGTTASGPLTFTTANWATAQTVNLSTVDDFIADGNQYFAIVGSFTSTDTTYDGTYMVSPNFTNVDDELPGVTVSALSGNVIEGSPGPTFTVVLNTAPTANVTVTFPLGTLDTTEVTGYSPATITFTPFNWNFAQTVTVIDANDPDIDGNQAITLDLGSTSSIDAIYNGLSLGSFSTTSVDTDVAGVSVTPTYPTTWEAGGSTTLSVTLSSRPVANVTVGPINISATPEATMSSPVAGSSFTFTPANFNIPQTIVLNGQDDVALDGPQAYQVTLGNAASADGNYVFAVPAVNLINNDNETPGKMAYVTHTTYQGNLGGVAGADAKCMSDSRYPGVGTFRAFITDGTNRVACTTANCSFGLGAAEHVNWIMTSNTSYYRQEDGLSLFTSNLDGIFPFGIFTNPWSSVSGTYYWSGFYTTIWTANSAIDCTNFTSTVGSSDVGRLDLSTSSAVYGGTMSCTNWYPIVCIEQ